jgi:hypothetical protein
MLEELAHHSVRLLVIIIIINAVAEVVIVDSEAASLSHVNFYL